MLVQCPQCGAAYDFPDERVTAKGLRAACGRCKLVMLVKPAGADGNAVVEVPQAAVRQTQVKRPRRRAAKPTKRVSKSAKPRRTDSIHSSTRQSAAANNAEPSIVVDMGHFKDDESEPPHVEQPSEPPIDPEVLRQAESALAFAPLSVAPVQLSNPRYAPPMPAQFEDEGDLPVIRQAVFLKTTLVLLFLGLIGFVVFVAWKNNWGPVWEDPRQAVRVALELNEPPASAASVAPIVEPQSTGELGVDGVTVEWLNARAALVRGTVNNRSNRIHRAIGLDVAVLKADLPLGARVVPCCTVFELDAAKKIAKDAKHVHFDPSLRTGQVSLNPGDTAPFTAILRGLPAETERAGVVGRVRIKYSDPERVKAP